MEGMAAMRHYVLGFIFNCSRTKVLLVKKESPEWQKGYWNGIGGKIGDRSWRLNESPLEAMQRECMEEVGYEYDWEHCITFVCSGGIVFVYKAISDYGSAEFSDPYGTILYQQIEDEELKVRQVNLLPDLKMDKEVNWLIPVCLSDIQFPICVNLKDVEKHTEKSEK